MSENEIERQDDSSIGRARAVTTSQQEIIHRAYLHYLVLPLTFLTVALLGGVRLSGDDSSLIFLMPPLVCLVFAAMLFVLFFRSGAIAAGGWFSDKLPMLTNISNAGILLTAFAAAAQIFNSVLPERGAMFWIVGFCFFWTLWNDLFAGLDAKRLLRSLAALFGLAFVVKYLILANLTAPAGQSWLQRLTENPAQEAFTWALDLPRFSPGTGYIQFLAAALFVTGLFLLPRTMAGGAALIVREDRSAGRGPDVTP